MKEESKHKPYNAVYENLYNGASKGVLQLTTQNNYFDGRSITLNNKEVINFGSCSYLGLEVHPALKEAAIAAVTDYGIQVSSSRAYLSCGLYEQLENQLSQLFGGYCILGQSTSLVHYSTIPIIVDDHDAVILDHQAHGSVQNAVNLIRPRGIKVEVIRHNNLQMLEDKIKQLRDTHFRIWYMIDGVYSMFGDYAPLAEIEKLMQKYPQLHLYVDDAHGMSWIGENGKGYALTQIPSHPKMVFATSLSKGFGTSGGVAVFHDKNLMTKVKTVGSSFVFSGPIQPPSLGASIASATIHLSDEIYDLQNNLQRKISFCHRLIVEKKIPYVLPSSSPIFYLALGMPKAGYNMIARLIKEGFYTNVGVFPVVPVTRTGIRLPITVNHTYQDISNVLDAIEYHYPLVMQEEGQDLSDLEKYFKMDFSDGALLVPKLLKIKKELTLKCYNSINEIDKSSWDELLGNRGSFDWNGCHFLESVFADNKEPENNWNFYYFIIRDQEQKIVLATFFTDLICKDDLISPENISLEMEKLRANNKYYMTRKILMMGSLLTEGDHLYLDRKKSDWQQALLLLLENLTQLRQNKKITTLNIRDIDSDDLELRDFFINQGFFRVDMPDCHIFDMPEFETDEELISNIKRKKYRYTLRKEIIPSEKFFDVRIVDKATSKEIEYWDQLYNKVKNKKLILNTFDLPGKIYKKILDSPHWIVLELSLKKEYQVEAVSTPLCVCFLHKGKSSISPMFLGLDYDYLYDFEPYRQTLFQIIKLGKRLDVDQIFFGMEAHIEKSRFGAISIKKSGYIQSNENYSQVKLEGHVTTPADTKPTISIISKNKLPK
jgi:7-keto-8-aminopelargonate synthetase-like enzyme